MHILASAFLALPSLSVAMSEASIFKGRGFGTYYYDVKHPKGSCGADFSNMNLGVVECSSNTNALSLNKINSNFLVAMNHTQLQRNPKKYCGKQVVVTVNGKASDLPFFIGDGCVRCGKGRENGGWNSNGAPGLDFSYSALNELSSRACQNGYIDISWEITDKTVYHF